MLFLIIFALVAICLLAYELYVFCTASTEKEAGIASLISLFAGALSFLGALITAVTFFMSKSSIIDEASRQTAGNDFLFALKLGGILLGAFSLVILTSMALSADFRIVRGIMTPLFAVIIAMVGYGAFAITQGGALCRACILALCIFMGGILFFAVSADLHIFKRKLCKDDEFRRSRAFKAASKKDSRMRKKKAKITRKELKRGTKNKK